MNSGSVKKKGKSNDDSDSHIYKVLSNLIQHLKEEHKLTKEDLIKILD